MQMSSRQQFFHWKLPSKQLTIQTTSYKKKRDIPPSATVAAIQLSPVCEKLIVCNHKQVQIYNTECRNDDTIKVLSMPLNRPLP